ncbi:MAG: phosphohydrolase [Chloroflexi bacterium HGW-Chloroflexi-10]|nr:MAG: phosphohydrolase [Chloroflexi bacterium HGW-Chloroflexi-10]
MEQITRRKFLKLGLAGSVLLVSYPFMVERYLIQLNHYRVYLKNLPAGFQGFRIAHLTDIHYGSLTPLWLVEHVVAMANRQAANIIVCTGDYVHERDSIQQIDEVWPVLSKLTAPQGVFSVLGNHDHWASTSQSLKWLEHSNQNLRHRAVRIDQGNDHIWLGGCGDLWEDELGVDLAFSSAPPQDFKIMLAHNPDTTDRSFNTRLDLILSGHTHGGQVAIPFVGAPIVPVQNKNYTSGFFQTNNGTLFISRGIGWTILPVRFNCPPEIAVLELVNTA